MEGLAPTLQCLIEIQSALQNGESLRAGLNRYTQVQTQPQAYAFAQSLKHFLFAWDQGQDWRAHIIKAPTPHRRALMEIIAFGLNGQAILPQLAELQSEVELACELDIKRFLDLLPLQMLIPLLFFQFPAFLILLFGPLLSHFLMEVSR
jgi:hypothetical protein